MREAEDDNAAAVDSPANTPTYSHTPILAARSYSRANLMPLPAIEPAVAEGRGGKEMCVISLNLGGRNTNPAEFELKGDNSDIAVETMAMLRKAKKALGSPHEGPAQLPATEVALVEEILTDIYNGTESEGLAQVRKLLRCETWRQVLSSVEQTNPHFFNAFNLSTLEFKRPSVWEDPSSCISMSTTNDYLGAWRNWYRGLNRRGQFWTEDAPCLAKRRGMDVATAFAGLLVFDLMSMCTARRAINMGAEEDVAEEGREVPFKRIAGCAAKLPSTNLEARHAVAANFMAGSHVLLAQEADKFADHQSIIEEFMPPFYAADGCTAVFLRKNFFKQATDISSEVSQRMQKLLEEKAPDDEGVRKAWRSMARRLAAVHCHSHPSFGGYCACFVSLHCPTSAITGDFIESLRDVLADFDADIHAVGMDANCAGEDAAAFRQRLRKSRFELGCQPKQQQVTVAKERTPLQTQVRKRGAIDISHKDFIVSWVSSRTHRGPTSYTPDIRTPYGVEQETKQCIRLPTTQWPFDHCGVATTFTPGFRCNESVRCSWNKCGSLLTTIIMVCALLLPLASPQRSGVYGDPGTWYFSQRSMTLRWGICEGAAPCLADWIEDRGSCYRTTPEKLPYPSGNEFCNEFNSTLVTISSEAENQFVTGRLCPPGEFCYIGLQGLSDGRPPWWVSGEEVNYTRIATTGGFPLPLFPMSRRSDFIAAILHNLPNEHTGFDYMLGLPFGRGPPSLKRLLMCLPAVAMVVSGVLLALPRPKDQRFATLVLRLAFWANAAVWFMKVYLTSFADGFDWYMTIFKLQYFMEAIFRSGTSVLSMSMVVRRMSTLYPAKGIRLMFSALVVLVVLFFVNYGLFVDNTASLRVSPAVIAQAVMVGLITLLVSSLCLKTSADLYKSWVLLRKEAATGLSSQGRTSLTASIRAAKFHFITVLISTFTSFLRWATYFAVVVSTMQVNHFVGIHIIATMAGFVDSITNDVCVHVLAVMNMDGAVVRAKGITAEAAERAGREIEQHRLAVRMLKAAPTSPQQIRQMAALEQQSRNAINTDQEKPTFLIFQSAIRVETVRIHRLMQCVRMRAMTMPVRYQYLINIPSVESMPRQYVPARFAGKESEAVASAYFDWLYAEAAGAQQVFFSQVKQMLATFNGTPWSTDLGLAHEEFPWAVWPGGPHRRCMKRLQKGEDISPGDIMQYHAPGTCMLGHGTTSICFVLEETSSSTVRIHRCGMESPEEVPREHLRYRDGGAVFVPGPQKKRDRCLDKVMADYDGKVAWPAAASLVDITRCMILLDDPYAIAVLVAYISKTMQVLRVKNRFSEDMLETPSPEELQSMFFAASCASSSGRDSEQSEVQTSHGLGTYQYRDVALNVVIASPNGVPVVCEIQVSLSNLAILKGADQKLYTVRRMKSPGELSKSYVFVPEEFQSPAPVGCDMG